MAPSLTRAEVSWSSDQQFVERFLVAGIEPDEMSRALVEHTRDRALLPARPTVSPPSHSSSASQRPVGAPTGTAARPSHPPGAGEISEAAVVGGRLSFWRSQARAVLSIAIVGIGASLGREGAPQLTGAAVATALSDWAKLPAWQRRLLVARGAGAGMAAVYNVPFGGALFAVEVLLGKLTLPVVLPAVAMSAIATAVAWIAIPDRPTYQIPTFGVTGSQVVWAVIIGPLAGLIAVGWVRAIAAVNTLKPRRRGRVLAPVIIFTALGAVSITYPQLLGNGKDTVQQALTNQLAVGLLAVLVVLKPLATAACLGSGAPGGLCPLLPT